MTPAQLPWQPWGLEKEVSTHRPGPTGAGILTESQNCTRDPHCLSWAVPASEHVQMWPKWKPHACLSGLWRRALTSVSAVIQRLWEGVVFAVLV